MNQEQFRESELIYYQELLKLTEIELEYYTIMPIVTQETILLLKYKCEIIQAHLDEMNGL